jgi:glutaryl-CoA dehydrogenase (non-decarboxylating)
MIANMEAGMQAEYVLGYLVDKSLNKMLPAWTYEIETVKSR